jgi:hypothetical protein
MLNKEVVKVEAEFICLKIEISGALCKHGNESPNYIKAGDFLTN